MDFPLYRKHIHRSMFAKIGDSVGVAYPPTTDSEGTIASAEIGSKCADFCEHYHR